MSDAFDQRIVQVSIEFEDGVRTFEGLSIYASGRKFLAAPMNQCEFKIFNLTKEQRNYILSRTSPLNLNRHPIKISLDIGRESYGTFRLFDGYVMAAGCTQPPDIGITLTALTNNFAVGVILSDTQSSLTQLKIIAQKIADNNQVKLDFQATDKQIENFSFSGAASTQIQKLNDMGGILAFIDNGALIVLDAGKPKKGVKRLLNLATGMVGIPQFTQKGILVKMMVDNTVNLGNLIEVKSELLPAADGDYIVQKIYFDIASRDQHFFYTLDCISVNYFAGTT